MEVNGQDGLSDLQYVFLATNAFNEGKYEDSIIYSEAFLDAVKNQEGTDPGDVFSRQQFEPQERMVLHYYVQLIFAHAHFENAEEYFKDSKDWDYHMEIAENMCEEFKRSSRSLFYIADEFRTLQNSIDVVYGKNPENLDGEGKAGELCVFLTIRPFPLNI